jgi:hypothetical protein
MKKAHIYLEKLQEKAYSIIDKPSKVRKDILDYYNNEVLNRVETTEGNQSATPQRPYLLTNTLPTKYEVPASYEILTVLAGDIEKGLKNLNSSIDLEELKGKVTVPAFGSLLTTEVNACAIAVPKSKEYLVVFESDLFNFCLLLSKVVALFFPIDYQYDFDKSKKELIHDIYSIVNQNIARKINEDSRILTRFKDLVFAVTRSGTASHAAQYRIEEQYAIEAYWLRHSMELFIMGHEYGHILRNHVSHSTAVPAHLVGEEVTELFYLWDHEYEADLEGLNFMLAASYELNIDPAISIRGPTLFFDMIDIMDRAKSIVRTGGENALGGMRSSHPPPLLRRERIRHYIANTWGNSPYGEQLLEPSFAIDNIMEALWKSIVSDLQRLHDRETI